MVENGGEVTGSGVGAVWRVRREWTEGLFYFLFLVTVVEGAFIVWDMLTMYAPFARAVGLAGANTFTASADMSNLYLALLGVYAGLKEFRKWAQLDDAQALTPENEEKITWFGRGTVIVFFWIALALVATVLKDCHLIARLPNELYRVALQSLAVWAGTSASSSLRGKKLKNKKAEAAGTPDGADPAENARLNDAHRQQVLEYLAANELIDSVKCQELTKLNRFQAYRLLDSLEAEGVIAGEGSTKGRIYKRKNDLETAQLPLNNGKTAQ